MEIKEYFETNKICYRAKGSSLDDLFFGLEPVIETDDYDIYTIGDVAIVTGRNPFGKEIQDKTIEVFKAAAIVALQNLRYDFDEFAKVANELRKDLAGTLIEKEDGR